MTTNNNINVANNVARRNSQDLTEQWKKSKLETGEEYWVILTDEWYFLSPGVPVRAFYSCDCEFEGYLDNDIKEVLAPVPSYEEWQSLNELLDSMQDTNKALAHRLNMLKKLLKECKFYIGYDTYEFDEKVNKLITKIDEALR